MRQAISQRLAIPRGMTHRPLGASLEARDWLTHVSSLTARIRARCQHFEVKVRFEGLGCANSYEAALLGRRRCYIREVELWADGHAVVAARTVLDPTGLRGPWRFLVALGTRPLGARLFTDPCISRSPFMFLSKITEGERAQVRMARISRKGLPIVLSEALLPALFGLDSI